MELCSELCASLAGSGAWMHVSVWLSTSALCSPETITTLLSATPQYKIKSLKFGEKTKQTVDGLQRTWV